MVYHGARVLGRPGRTAPLFNPATDARRSKADEWFCGSGHNGTPIEEPSASQLAHDQPRCDGTRLSQLSALKTNCRESPVGSGEATEPWRPSAISPRRTLSEQRDICRRPLKRGVGLHRDEQLGLRDVAVQLNEQGVPDRHGPRSESPWASIQIHYPSFLAGARELLVRAGLGKYPCIGRAGPLELSSRSGQRHSRRLPRGALKWLVSTSRMHAPYWVS